MLARAVELHKILQQYISQAAHSHDLCLGAWSIDVYVSICIGWVI